VWKCGAGSGGFRSAGDRDECGRPKIYVRPGETGFVAANVDEFVRHIWQSAVDSQKLEMMRVAA
jgi:hypothetical protein